MDQHDEVKRPAASGETSLFEADRYQGMPSAVEPGPSIGPGLSYIDRIARVCHEANRGYCLAFGDLTQLPWEIAPEWQKESARKGVEMHLDNEDATPRQSHESWLEQKRSDGWKYGPVKNPETKEHPCFVNYDELPIEQRAKDYIFKGVVDGMRDTKRVPSGQAHFDGVAS